MLVAIDYFGIALFLRDGDRYWYQWTMSAADIVEIDDTTLADVIRRNTMIGAEISDDAFHVN